MATARSDAQKTLACPACGKRFRVAAGASHGGRRCPDCGAALRLVRPPGGRSQDEGRPPARRRKSAGPIYVALAASAVLLVAAILVFTRVDWSAYSRRDEAGREAARLKREEERRRQRLRALADEKDPFDLRLEKVVEALHAYRTDEIKGYFDPSTIFDFTMSERQAERRWRDLSMTERLTYPDRLVKTEAFGGRWRLAKLGPWRRQAADVPGYLDHEWLVVPRAFPGGDKDEVWLLVRNQGGWPRICGSRVKQIARATVARQEDEPIKIPEITDPGFKKLDTGLKKAPLPVAARPGAIDETGAPTAAVRKVKRLEGTPPALLAKIRAHLATLVDPGATLTARQALKELVFIGKPAIPVLLNQLVGRNLRDHDDVYRVHQIIQALREITGKRFGFEPQTGVKILTAATEAEQHSALRRWFGWWKVNGKNFTPELTPRLKEELEKRRRRAERMLKK